MRGIREPTHIPRDEMIISDDFQHRERSHRQQQAGSNRDVRVYIARYDYNPFEGPNNCPELELFLQAGELYIADLVLENWVKPPGLLIYLFYSKLKILTCNAKCDVPFGRINRLYYLFLNQDIFASFFSIFVFLLSQYATGYCVYVKQTTVIDFDYTIMVFEIDRLT